MNLSLDLYSAILKDGIVNYGRACFFFLKSILEGTVHINVKHAKREDCEASVAEVINTPARRNDLPVSHPCGGCEFNFSPWWLPLWPFMRRSVSVQRMIEGLPQPVNVFEFNIYVVATVFIGLKNF